MKLLRKKSVIRLLVFLCIIAGVAWNADVVSIKAASAGTTESTTATRSDTAENTTTTESRTATGENNSNQSTGLTVSFNNGNGEFSSNIQILLVLTLIAIAPTLLIMLTSFTRIIIVLHFTRAALNTQTAPPNQVLIGLAVFLTIFIMSPIFNQINVDAVQPFNNGEITQEQAIEAGMKPLREFMYGQTKRKDVQLFMDISGEIDKIEEPNEITEEDIPTYVLIPSFIISELRTAFIIGFLIYIPFIIIDMVVASVLMSMGMMMLPPTTISMPFKILLFVLADGWNLVIGSLVKTFY
ncbi:MAG: flagellar type III secretion system pore protein FliP [Lachnospiraceae bacterium]|nr:flagellar type III secretion system pore protein FliP [Lachnospiraceae bacterium]